MQAEFFDRDLLSRFQVEIGERVPHFGETPSGRVLRNPTPLVDITRDIVECAAKEYGKSLDAKNLRVLAKLDSQIFGGSVKTRPAVRIVEQAIATGRLRSGQAVFEATSGNFGLALGSLGKLGLNVVVIVSRKLQSGVIQKLKDDGLKIVNLDIDICPAPGMQMSPDLAVAKGVAASVRQQLRDLGFEVAPFDGARAEVEALLARQDAIGLAKLLARAYGGFCPEQYDNEQNVESHVSVTGPEIESQLKAMGLDVKTFQVVCAFGTGGTATGLSTYLRNGGDEKSVRVVFPLPTQDVAGIRTKDKALGLKFYLPGTYAAEDEVDFEKARKCFAFFNSKGYDVGESGALALYGAILSLGSGGGRNLVVMIADGASKYPQSGLVPKDEVTLTEASASIGEFSSVIWTHTAFVPKEEGIKVIASSLGCDEGAVKVANARDVQSFLSTGKLTGEMSEVVKAGTKRVLLVCMMGNTSLVMARMLAQTGVPAASLKGGITGIPAARSRPPFELVKMAGA